MNRAEKAAYKIGNLEKFSPGVSAKNGFGSCVGFDPYHCAASDD